MNWVQKIWAKVPFSETYDVKKYHLKTYGTFNQIDQGPSINYDVSNLSSIFNMNLGSI